MPHLAPCSSSHACATSRSQCLGWRLHAAARSPPRQLWHSFVKGVGNRAHSRTMLDGATAWKHMSSPGFKLPPTLSSHCVGASRQHGVSLLSQALQGHAAPKTSVAHLRLHTLEFRRQPQRPLPRKSFAN